jgi:magnesium transporter
MYKISFAERAAMNQNKITQEMRDNIDGIIKQDSPLEQSLWQVLLQVHPADIAGLIAELARDQAQQLFVMLPKELRIAVFKEQSDHMKSVCLSFLSEADKVEALHALSIDDLADLFDQVSDEDLKKYLNLLHIKAREKVISLLQFDPESAGGIMETEVLTLMQDFTVEKSIKMLQRLRPRREVHQQIYVTNQQQQLVGHIALEDLVLQHGQTRISSFLRKNEFVAYADQDQEIIAKQMVHYGLTTVPVIGSDDYFLGVIPSETLMNVLVEEASEDVQKMAALAPLKQTYFETPFFQLVYNRGYILVVLLVAESFSGSILKVYEETLQGLLVFFIPMLISAGGNTSSQSSAVVIQGIATGEIHHGTFWRFMKREFMSAAALAVILAATAFARVYFFHRSWQTSIIVSLSLGFIVLLAVTLGSCIPIVLKRLNIDPAFSAGPFLATLMDILGILIYCYISQLILSYYA